MAERTPWRSLLLSRVWSRSHRGSDRGCGGDCRRSRL